MLNTSLTTTQKSILKIVVDRFFRLAATTKRKRLVIQLKGMKASNEIDDLVSKGFLKNSERNEYLPTCLAVHVAADQELLQRVKHSVAIVLRTLQNLYETSEGAHFTAAEVETHARKMYQGLNSETVQWGLYFVPEFNVVESYGGVQQGIGIVHITPSESIMSVNDFDRIWDRHVERRGYASVHEPRRSGVPNPIPSGQRLTDWEVLRKLGEGGQSEVFLVRVPERKIQMAACLEEIRRALDEDDRKALAAAIWNYARSDSPTELGALKRFSIPPDPPEAAEAKGRLRNEIAVLQKHAPGLARLLGANEAEAWIVTEFYPDGTLDKHFAKYRGNASKSIHAFRSIVEAVCGLHKHEIVHRDIKPQNIFLSNGELILGDFGIAFLPGAADRLTITNEKVGPRDFMPPWADIGGRLEKVHCSFDVYMLGKVLWCMVVGKMKLPREYHKLPQYDVTGLFPYDPYMHMVQQILDKTVVEFPEKCLQSAEDLLLMVDSMLRTIERGGTIVRDDVPRPCRVCGTGAYKKASLPPGSQGTNLRLWVGGSDSQTFKVSTFVCDYCGHVQFFNK